MMVTILKPKNPNPTYLESNNSISEMLINSEKVYHTIHRLKTYVNTYGFAISSELYFIE